MEHIKKIYVTRFWSEWKFEKGADRHKKENQTELIEMAPCLLVALIMSDRSPETVYVYSNYVLQYFLKFL